MHAIHGRVLPNFSFSFLPKLFMALCHEWHAQSKCMPSMAECCPIFFFSFFSNFTWHSAMNGMHNLNACRSWQSAAQFFLFFLKAFIQTQNYWHLYTKLAGIYTRNLLAFIQEKNMLAFIQEGQIG